MTLRPLPSEFPSFLGKFPFLFYQCTLTSGSLDYDGVLVGEANGVVGLDADLVVRVRVS